MSEKKMDIHYWCASFIKNKFIFPIVDYNSFFSVSLDDYKLEHIGNDIYESDDAYALYAHSVQNGDKCYFFPNNSHHIVVIDGKNGGIDYLTIPSLSNDENYVSGGEIVFEEKIYLFPQNVNMGIWEIDTRGNQLKKRDDLLCLIADEQIGGSPIIDIGEGRGAYITGDNGLRIFDIKNKKYKKKIFSSKYMLFRPFYHDKEFWFIQILAPAIIRWNPENDYVIEYKTKDDVKLFRDGIPYSNLCFIENKVIVLNYSSCNVMEFSPDEPEKGIKKAFSFPKDFSTSRSKTSGFDAVFNSFNTVGNCIYFHPSCANMMLIYDIKKDIVRGVRLNVQSEILPQNVKLEWICNETALNDLSHFVNDIVS